MTRREAPAAMTNNAIRKKVFSILRKSPDADPDVQKRSAPILI